MPILSRRAKARIRDAHGNESIVPAPETLRTFGPRLDVLLSPLDEQIKEPSQDDGDAPAPVQGYALIDTGASDTCIDRDAAKQAGLAVVDSGPMNSATHTNEIVPIYAGRITIHGFGVVDVNKAYGANLKPLGLIGLIGRDILSRCQFTYNGIDGSFTLAT